MTVSSFLPVSLFIRDRETIENKQLGGKKKKKLPGQQTRLLLSREGEQEETLQTKQRSQAMSSISRGSARKQTCDNLGDLKGMQDSISHACEHPLNNKMRNLGMQQPLNLSSLVSATETELSGAAEECDGTSTSHCSSIEIDATSKV